MPICSLDGRKTKTFYYFRCLETVVSMFKDLKEDLYLVPYAIVEIALIYVDQGKKEQAILALEDAK